MVWKTDRRKKSGGYLKCLRRDAEQHLRRYDTDPVYRIGMVLKNSRRGRAERLAARKLRLKEGGYSGALPQ